MIPMEPHAANEHDARPDNPVLYDVAIWGKARWEILAVRAVRETLGNETVAFPQARKIVLDASNGLSVLATGLPYRQALDVRQQFLFAYKETLSVAQRAEPDPLNVSVVPRRERITHACPACGCDVHASEVVCAECGT